jgi:hypothetical protein
MSNSFPKTPNLQQPRRLHSPSSVTTGSASSQSLASMKFAKSASPYPQAAFNTPIRKAPNSHQLQKLFEPLGHCRAGTFPTHWQYRNSRVLPLPSQPLRSADKPHVHLLAIPSSHANSCKKQSLNWHHFQWAKQLELQRLASSQRLFK